jgi:hypothetical protein
LERERLKSPTQKKRSKEGDIQMKKAIHFFVMIALASIALAFCSAVVAQEDLPYYLHDRGGGIPLSMFNTFIEQGEVIIYPFFEYYYDQDAEYKPEELGYELGHDFRGRYRAYEALLFLGYGVSERLAVEAEAAVIKAAQHKSDADTSSMPKRVEESGLGDVEGQLRWRWLRETASSPELFSYFETVFPLRKGKKLIGTQAWEFKLGSGVTKGFRWGTMTLRLAGEYDAGENKAELGEYAVEYLKRISRLFRFYVGMEGAQDEVEAIVDLQFHINPKAFIRINNAFGATSKATDWAPEVGALFHF